MPEIYIGQIEMLAISIGIDDLPEFILKTLVNINIIRAAPKILIRTWQVIFTF